LHPYAGIPLHFLKIIAVEKHTIRSKTMEFKECMTALGEELKGPHKFSDDGEEWEIEIPLAEERKQIIKAYMFQEMEQDILRIYSIVGERKKFTDNQLISTLELNISLLYGAFALFAGNLVLTTTIPADAPREKAAAIIHYVARMADSYELMNIGLDKN
jgi:hypothetical protein